MSNIKTGIDRQEKAGFLTELSDKEYQPLMQELRQFATRHAIDGKLSEEDEQFLKKSVALLDYNSCWGTAQDKRFLKEIKTSFRNCLLQGSELSASDHLRLERIVEGIKLAYARDQVTPAEEERLRETEALLDAYPWIIDPDSGKAVRKVEFYGVYDEHAGHIDLA